MRARAGEIAANILNQIELSGYNAQSLSRIVLVGGGAKLPEFATLLGTQCKMPVRMAEMPADITFRVPGRNNPDNIDIIALLAAGAGRSGWECLSALPEPAADFEPVSDDEEVAPEEGRHRTVVVEHPASQPASRRLPDEDDETLLSDDEDEPADIEEPKRRRNFFGLGRKQKDPEPVEEEDKFDVFKDDDEPDESDDPDNEVIDDDPDHYKKTTHAIDNILSSFAKIFKSDVSDDDDQLNI